MVEAEVKAPIRSVDRFRRRLTKRGATRSGRVEQTDRYFDHPSRSFAETDEALRVRTEGDAVELTYKGPKLDEETKSRLEVSVGVWQDEALAGILEALGFDPVATVRKEREIFELEGVTVTIDEVEGVGSFAELEQRVPEDELAEARQRLLALAEELSLDRLERRSYLELMLEEERG